MNPRIAVLVGGAIIVVPPTILGLVVAHFTDRTVGTAAGMILFGIILYFGWRLLKRTMRDALPRDKGKQ